MDVERGRTVKSWKPRRLGVCACLCVFHVCVNECTCA